MSGDIGLRRVYAEAAEDEGYRVLVDRLWPRGVSRERAQIDEWCREIAPSDDLRVWFDHRPDRWEGFVERFRAELVGKGDLVSALADHARSGRLTLVYAAKEERYNNAVALRQVLLEHHTP